MQVLVVEDDARMASLLERGLAHEGHVVCLARDGTEGLEIARAHDFDVVVLDVMLPGIDGYEVARRLRAAGCKTPVLMLTARDTTRDVVAGLDAGADDYLTKPFSFEELLARIRAAGRRGPAEREAVLTVGDLRLDPARHEAQRGGRRIELTPREFQLLELLMSRAGLVLSRDCVIERVWGHETDVEHNTVDVFIGKLRRKVDGPAEVPLIHTVRGVGFCVRAAEH